MKNAGSHIYVDNWAPLRELPALNTRFVGGPPQILLTKFVQSPFDSRSVDLNPSPTIQLLRLFLPHPSRHHWFPSWTQVQQYPDVCMRGSDAGQYGVEYLL